MTIETLAQLDEMCAEGAEFETQILNILIEVDRLPESSSLRVGLSLAIDLIRKYQLPCDVRIRDLAPNALAAHGFKQDGTCVIELSKVLAFDGDRRSVQRTIIHEIAHHMAGPGHGHDESFRRIASGLYEREGFPRGGRGDHRGNMC
jgi:hypothetical protein